MPQDFKLSIELGNDAMQTAEDVANALQDIADELASGASDGHIRDDNGNTVGTWELS
jgi:Flp pilus assembly protein TadG